MPEHPRNDGTLVCSLCYPTLVVFGEVVPGYVLAYQEEECRDIPARHYALFDDHHSPAFVWPQEPVESTEDRFGREESETWADDDPRVLQEERHVESVAGMEEHFCRCGPMTGYRLANACLAAGYQYQNSGMPLYWLANRMARLIAGEPITHDEAMRGEGEMTGGL